MSTCFNYVQLLQYAEHIEQYSKYSRDKQRHRLSGSQNFDASDADDTGNCTIDLLCDKLVNRALRPTPSSKSVSILPILLILPVIATRYHIAHMPWMFATDASKSHSSLDDYSTCALSNRGGGESVLSTNGWIQPI